MSVALGLTSAILAGAGTALAHLEVIEPLAGLTTVVCGAVCGLAAVVGSLLDWIEEHRGRAAFSFLCAAPSVGVVAFLASMALSHPEVSDVSTDLDTPPQFVLARAVTANTHRNLGLDEIEAERIRRSYPNMRPLDVSAGAPEAFSLVLDLAKRQPRWVVTRIDRNALEIEGYTVSQVLRVRDDFIVRVKPIEEGARIDMRSRSRFGTADLGVNEERIRNFFDELRKTLGPAPPPREKKSDPLALPD